MGKIIDLTGKKFGKLTVIRKIDKSESLQTPKTGHPYWLCICNCGKNVIVGGQNLRTGHTKSCGCTKWPRSKYRLAEDLTNKRFGKLTVIERLGKNQSKDHHSPNNYNWKCQCDCGEEIITRADLLIYYNKRSCGCLTNETNTRLKLGKANKKKGTSKYIGVRLTYSGTWDSRIRVNKKQLYLGSFKNEDNAARAYNNAVIKYYGNNKNMLNKIEDAD